MKEFAEQLRAAVGGKLIEHIARRIGKRGAKTEDLLELLARIDQDGIVR
jgi:hypothetical protein